MEGLRRDEDEVEVEWIIGELRGGELWRGLGQQGAGVNHRRLDSVHILLLRSNTKY